MQNRRWIAGVLAVAALGLYGCGDDDDSTSADDETTTTAEAADGDLATYCDKTVEIEAYLAPGPHIDFETASPEEVTEATKAFFQSAKPIAAAIQEATPSENRANVDTLVAALDETIATGDFANFEEPEVDAASTADHEFALESCDWQQVDVTAVDYAFEGIPSSLETGPTSFEFDNTGTELHELVLFRKNDGTTESFDEILELEEAEAESKMTPTASAFGAPGEEGAYSVTDLEAGEYLALCFIPVGTVDEETESDGPPHYTEGMKQEFAVS